MLTNIIKSLLDIIYPQACIVCKRNLKGISNISELVCTKCWQKLKRNMPPFCHCCGRHLDKFNNSVCPRCIKKKLQFDRAFSPCVYEGTIKELIYEFKYRNKDYLGPILSIPMIEFIKEYDLPMDYIDLIIPIPLHRTRWREREFNQAEILGSCIAREFNKSLLNDNLVRYRATQTQTGLEEKERFLNVQDSFLVKDNKYLKGKNILLVDDILTTGSTSSEAAHTLKTAGANIVFVLTLAN